jgi:O-antigen ligase
MVQYPENPSVSPEISEKTKILDLILTLSFFLFVLACNFSISLTQIAGFLGVVFLLTRLHLTQSWKQMNLMLMWPFLAFLLAGILSTLLAVDPKSSMPFFKKACLLLIIPWVVNAAPYITLRPFRNFLKKFLKNWESISPLTLVFYVLIVATAVSALYGLLQGFSHGLSIDSRDKIHGTFSHVFTFSAVLMMINLLALAYLLLGTGKKTWLWVSFLIISLCLVFTFTRMSWAGFFLGAVFLLFFKKKSLIIIPPLILAVALLFGPDSISERITSAADLDKGSIQIRLAMWKAGVDIIKDYPWTGCGFDCLYLIHDQYPQHSILEKWFFNLHSNWVQITVDLGLLGIGTWTALWICYFVFLFRDYQKRSSTSPERWVFLGSGAVVISFLTAGTFETNFYDTEVVMVLYFIMALPFVKSSNAEPATAACPTASSIS